MTSTALADTLLDAIVTQLRTINGGSNYWNDFTTNSGGCVQRYLFQPFPVERPFLLVSRASEEMDDHAVRAAFDLTRAKLNFQVHIYTVDKESTAPATIEKLIYDVKKCLLASNTVRQLSGNACNVFLTSVDEPQGIGSDNIYCTVSGYVDYTYRTTEPSLTR